TGTFYSVQVGVFSIRDNAKALSRSLKKYGKRIDVKEKEISDKNYYVVYVGRFKSTDEAIAFKAILEKSENQAYQVIAR
ncbi:MAG: SPOR domain-containing protein, partial [candidate division Zixibacteria bacterium]|nr:SPOR domain-containing protein [candidate division Zixibacteria bacterium]